MEIIGLTPSDIMPELPEVETVRRVLEKWVLNKKIVNVFLYYPRIAENDLSVLINQKFLNIKRYGKMLIFELEDYILTSHLRMEGKYYYALKEEKSQDDKIGFSYEGKDEISKVRKHSHVIFLLEDDHLLIYHDVRKFGKMHVYKKEEFDLNKLGIGDEPFLMNKEKLFALIHKKNKTIKEVLLDQSIMSGLGNIYVDEVCFLSSILPTKKASEITKNKCQEIIDNSIIVLNEAIKAGGSTIKSYHSGNGVDGLFQRKLLVYGRNGKPCSKCQSTIEKIRVGGRGTCFCPKCQK